MNQENKSQQAIFIEQWNIYQNVIRNNYMYHEEIIDIVTEEINKFNIPSILDLGCGDSYVISQSIDSGQKIDYRGIDSSLSALEFGKANLEFVNGNVDLVNNDLLNELEKSNHSFDIILLGFSLHHLPTQDKQKCFSLIARLVSETGIFIFYDVEMEADEIRSAYIKRACDLFIDTWSDFDNETMKSITAHVEDNDIPENEQFYLNNFEQVGFSTVNKMFRDRDNLFTLYTAKK